ncbi:MAG: cyclic nucleotide-binding domain-containing protein [Candidatus Sumerlaeia bacterium]|nr:cyclic nucleotide-binding domain-containing protein [Candidatus Sumerlaeia bacterium]
MAADVEALYALTQSPVFHGAPRSALASLAPHARKVLFRADEVVVEQGKLEKHFALIIEGRMKVAMAPKNTPSVNRLSDIKLNELREGDCFGEYSLIDRTATSASITAVTPGAYFAIPVARLEEALEADDRFAKSVYANLLKLLLGRLRKKEREYDLSLLYD